MPTLTKNYTRDSLMIIQDLWFLAHNKAVREFLGKDEIFGFDHIDDGVSEVWENEELLKKLKNELAKKSHSQKNKFLEILNSAKKQIEEFEKLWQKDFFENKDELIEYIDQLESAMYANLIYSYLCEWPGTETEVADLSKKLRGADHLFAYSDRLIRATLYKLYPQFEKNSYSILVAEIKNDRLPTLEELKKRYVSFFNISNGKNLLGDWTDFKNNFPNFILAESSLVTSQNLKGTVANPGHAHGRVKVVRKNDEINKVEKGDIIVSAMTTPAMMVGIHKAAAIVTDEGGILCHAAVISRELGIPCVIGTKYATKIFKDGDLVEVDAEYGIISRMVL